MVYTTLRRLEKRNASFTAVTFYIRRYFRLTPGFLMASGLILLGPLAGSGPIWNETLDPFVIGCQNYWWTNILYFSNFVRTAETCVPHGWYLSCDLQFYIISPIIILALHRRPKMGILFLISGVTLSMLTVGILTYMLDLPPVSLFSLPDPKDIQEYLDMVGYKPYTHYSSYCVGMATGYLLVTKQKLNVRKLHQVLGWCLACLGCCLVVYGTWEWNSGTLPGWAVAVAYASSCRTMWSMGIAWLVIVCAYGYGGIINRILSWGGFVPLSRLTFVAYLIHPLLMYLYASYVRTPVYFSQYVVVYLYFGHLCLTFGLSFFLSLAFEMPFVSMEKMISRNLDRQRRRRRASFSEHPENFQHPEHPEIKDAVVLTRRRNERVYF